MDRGAVIATIIAFILVVLFLVLVGMKIIKTRCDACRRLSRSGSSQQSLVSRGDPEAGGEFRDPPPRYSVVVSADASGEKKDLLAANMAARRLGSTGSIESIVILPPPDYDQAIKDLETRGIYFDTSRLSPMPPAYVAEVAMAAASGSCRSASGPAEVHSTPAPALNLSMPAVLPVSGC